MYVSYCKRQITKQSKQFLKQLFNTVHVKSTNLLDFEFSLAKKDKIVKCPNFSPAF